MTALLTICFLCPFCCKHSFWVTVCKTVCPVLSDRCLSVLSVTLVYCGQTVGWIKMKLGMEVGLNPCHIVLDGTQPPKGQGHSPSIFGSCLLWTNDWMVMMPLGTEVGLSPSDIVLDGDPAPPPLSAHDSCGQTVSE